MMGQWIAIGIGLLAAGVMARHDYQANKRFESLLGALLTLTLYLSVVLAAGARI